MKIRIGSLLWSAFLLAAAMVSIHLIDHRYTGTSVCAIFNQATTPAVVPTATNALLPTRQRLGLSANPEDRATHSTGEALAAVPQGQAIPWDQLGAKAGQQYSGDGLGVLPTATGATLRCIFQKMEGTATRDGLWLTSTSDETNNNRFRVRAMAVGRADTLVRLSDRGEIQVHDGTAAYLRPGLTEEYSASMDGVRQDFLVDSSPTGEGELRVMLEVDGASVEQAADGATLTLANSGRAIAYNRLRVTDATGRELTANMEAVGGQLAVVVVDEGATYPLRIDPTFSDANWVSMNQGIAGTNGAVNACVVDASGNVYLGGSFTVVVNLTANCIAKWDGSTWSSLGSGMNGAVSSLVLDGSGNLYAGGSFTTAGGVAAAYIAKWNGSTWSPLGSGMSGAVRSLVLDASGNLYAGGDFATAGGATAAYIAKWDGSIWSPLGSGMNGVVYSLALDASGNLYAGGSFTTAGGVAANRIAKWNGSTWSSLGSGMLSVYSLALDSNGNLYAGGSFTTAGGVAASNIAKWNGSTWSPLGSGVNGRVNALVRDGSGNLYAGGTFTTAGGVAANDIAKWNGSTWVPLGLGMSGGLLGIKSLALDGSGNLYAGGDFTATGGVGASYLAKWNGSAWSAFGSGMNSNVSALALDGNGNLYAGGSFTTAGGVAANCIAKWNGSTWSSLGTGLSSVNSLALDGSGNLYAGGNFTTAGGVAANRIAKWNGSAWSPLGLGTNSTVRSLVLDGSGNLYAGGDFTTAGGVATAYIAKWNGNTWSPLGLGMNNAVYALVLEGSGNLYAGGRFTTNTGGVVARGVAKWNGNAWSSLGSGMINGGNSGSVYSLVLDGSGSLYAGGYITTAGGVAAAYIAKWDGSTWSPLGLGMDNAVTALAQDDSGNIYAGGYFTTAGGVAASRIAKWNGSTWSALGSGMNGSVSTLLLNGAKLYAGGSFITAGGKFSPYLAKALLAAPQIVIEQPLGTGLTSGVSISDFGPTAPGDSSGPVTYTIRNTGDSALTINQMVMTGGAAQEFIVNTSGMATTIGINGSTSFSVTFIPTAFGIGTASLHISNNSANQELFEVALTGGVVAPIYSLTYHAGPGGSISGTSPQSVSSGDDGTEVTALPNVGYSFDQWSDGVLTANRTELSVSADLTVTARFSAIPPTITSASVLPRGSVGETYSHDLTAIDGAIPYAWLVSGGSLPNGLNLGEDGSITGTPDTEGTATFTVQVTGNNGASSTQEFSISIDQPLTITTDNWLGIGLLDEDYSQQLSAMGGVPPYVWSVVPADSLPYRLSLSTDGLLSGWRHAGTFTVRVTDSKGTFATKEFRIDTYPPFYEITTQSPLAAGRVGTVYYQRLDAVLYPGGPPYRWSVAAGSLPSGLTLSEGGIISGTPKTEGTVTFTIGVRNGGGYAQKEFQLTIVLDQPVITSADAASGRRNLPFTYQITATQNPTAYDATNLPLGLSVNPTTGLISGTPLVSGTFAVPCTALNIVGTGQQVLNLIIEPPLPLAVITSPPFAAATANAPFSFQLAASNSAESFAIQNGPAWLGVNAVTGMLEGIPVVPGTVTVQVRASNTTGPGAWDTLSISIAPHPDSPVITSLAEARGRKNDPFTFQITAEPTATSYAIAEFLPAGISLTSAIGLLAGTPTVEGTFNLTVTASNAAGQSVATPLRIILGPARQIPVITSTTSFVADVGSSFATTVLSTNSPESFTFDNLPAGLVQTGTTGLISGTMATPGNFTFSVKATNVDGTGQAQTMVLRVQYPPDSPAVSSLTGPSGYVGVPFTYQIVASKPATSFTTTPLPAGLTLDSTTGVISGTPTTAGNSQVTLQAANASGLGEPRTLTFAIAPTPDTPEITGSLLEETTALAAFSYQIQTRSVLPVTGYTISGLPDGISANPTTGLISGAATVTGVFEVKLRASNLIGVGPEQILRLTVRGGSLVPKITSAASVAVQQGAALVYQISASNPPILAWQAAPLPDGLSLETATGRIIGKPVVPGTYQVTLCASNVNGAGDPLTLQIQVKPNLAAPVVVNPVYFYISKAQPIEMEIQVLNMPPTRPWVGGLGVFAEGLPDGVVMNSATGVLSGRPFSTAGNAWPIRFYAVNESGRGATVWATLYYLSYYGITITGPKQLSATAGQTLNFNVETNAPCWHYHFKINGSWYGCQSSNVHSIPASSLPLPGSHRYSIDAWGAAGDGFLDGLPLTVAPSPGAPVIQSPSSIYCTAGTSIATGLSASDAPTRYEVTYMSPAWPSGLVFNSSTGAFSGTVAQAGVVSFLARAYNAAGAGLPKEISMVFSAPSGAPAITTGGALLLNSGRLMQLSAAGDSTVSFSPRLMSQQPPLTGKVGVAFSHQFQATGNVVRYSITGLPDGLVYNENTGTISGEPAKPGLFELTVTPIGTTVSGQPVTISLQIAPATGTPAMTSLATAAAVAGTAFTWQFTASASPNGYNLGELPDWLALNPVTGSLTGTSTVPGDTVLQVSAYNALGQGLAQAFTIHVAAAAGTPVVNPPAGNLTGRVGVAFSATLSAVGTVDFYDATALPFGIALDSLTGVFSGTPVEPGTQVVPVWGVNAQGIGEPRSVTMVIAPAVGSPAFVGDPVLRLLEGQPFQHTFGTAPTATAYAADGLPSGWSFSTASGLLQATPLAGNYELQIEAWNVAGTSGKQPFEIRVFASSGALWQDEKFGAQAGDPAVAGWDADPDHDGISNTLERALALEPMTADSSRLPTANQQGGYLTFTYRQNKDATDLTFTPQVSSGLMSNSWSANGLTEIERIDKDTYWLVTVRDSTPLTSTPHRFMRLRVSRL